MRNNYYFLLVCAVCSLLVIAGQAAKAEEVGVIVTFQNGKSFGHCAAFTSPENGYDIMQKIPLPQAWSEKGAFGRQLCQINGVGDDVTGASCGFNGKYWGFFLADKNKNTWEYMPVGFDGGDTCWNRDFGSYGGHYCARDGDVIGFRYGEFGEFPAVYSFETVCRPLKIEDTEVFIDGKKQGGTFESGTIIAAWPNATLKFKIKLAHQYPFAVASARGEEIQDINGRVTVKDIDDGDNIEETVSFSALGTGRSDSEEIVLLLPLFVNDGTSAAELEIEGTLPTKEMQKIVVPFTVDIKKKRHDVRVQSSFEKSTVCAGQQASLFVNAVNFGRDDENQISMSIENQELGIALSDTFFVPAGDNPDEVSYRKTFLFTVPATAAVEDYRFLVTIHGADTSVTEHILKVKNCTKLTPSPKKSSTGSTDESGREQREELLTQRNEPAGQYQPITASTLQENTIQTGFTEEKTEKSFFERYKILIVLGGIELLLLVVIGYIALIVRR